MCSAGSSDSGRGRRQTNATTTPPKNENALKANAAPGPTNATSRPPSAGPIAWDSVNDVELSAIAGGRPARSTISGVTAWSTGEPSELPIDNNSVSSSNQDGLAASTAASAAR